MLKDPVIDLLYIVGVQKRGNEPKLAAQNYLAIGSEHLKP
jgi:hypothetical protein